MHRDKATLPFFEKVFHGKIVENAITCCDEVNDVITYCDETSACEVAVKEREGENVYLMHHSDFMPGMFHCIKSSDSEGSEVAMSEGLNRRDSIVEISERPYRVLVVEDSIVQQKIISRRLQEASQYTYQEWIIICVSTAEDAIDVLESTRSKNAAPIDLMVLDYQLNHVFGGLTSVDVLYQALEIDHESMVVVGCTSNKRKHEKSFLDAGALEVRV